MQNYISHKVSPMLGYTNLCFYFGVMFKNCNCSALLCFIDLLFCPFDRSGRCPFLTVQVAVCTAVLRVQCLVFSVQSSSVQCAGCRVKCVVCRV